MSRGNYRRHEEYYAMNHDQRIYEEYKNEIKYVQKKKNRPS